MLFRSRAAFAKGLRPCSSRQSPHQDRLRQRDVSLSITYSLVLIHHTSPGSLPCPQQRNERWWVETSLTRDSPFASQHQRGLPYGTARDIPGPRTLDLRTLGLRSVVLQKREACEATAPRNSSARFITGPTSRGSRRRSRLAVSPAWPFR